MCYIITICYIIIIPFVDVDVDNKKIRSKITIFVTYIYDANIPFINGMRNKNWNIYIYNKVLASLYINEQINT